MKSKFFLLIVAIVAVGLFSLIIQNTEAPIPSPLEGPSASDTSKTVSAPRTSKPTSVVTGSVIAPAAPSSTKTVKVNVLNSGSSTYYSSEQAKDMVSVSNPPAGSFLVQPATLSGLARGGWFYSKQFPVMIVDARGKVVAEGYVLAQANTGSNDPVPFLLTMTYPAQPSGSSGAVIFMNHPSSPSGKTPLSVEVAVKFR